MEPIVIKGGNRLTGRLRVQGSKNATLPLLAAALLIDGVTTLTNCPDITDVSGMLKLLSQFGCRIVRCQHTVTIDARNVYYCEPDAGIAGAMRASSLLLAASLARFHQAALPMPGGCTIGKRPLDGHMEALRQMGAHITAGERNVFAEASCLTGCVLEPMLQSVGITEQLILAAVCAKGVTTIKKCAREPEIFSLCQFLQAAGADILYLDDEIMICGGATLHDVCFEVPGDRIIAASYLCMGLSVGCDMTLYGIETNQLTWILSYAKKMQCHLEIEQEHVHIRADKQIEHIPYLETAVYPGFPTDLQSVVCAMLATADGTSVVVETIFENRLQAAKELGKFGADVRVDEENRSVTIVGRKRLNGAVVAAKELRGGVALILAGLRAEGETTVYGCEYIVRGHESIVEDLRSLGAQIAWMR